MIQLYIYIIFYILFHDGLSEDIEYTSIYGTVGPCYLSVLSIVSARAKVLTYPCSLSPMVTRVCFQTLSLFCSFVSFLPL